MKAKTKIKRLLGILLALSMVVGMLPTVALAEESATDTADFSADPTTALGLLNAAKTDGAEDSTWDSTTNTLTLNGVNFETSAVDAVKLPDGAKITLADGTTNTIKGGDAATGDCYGIYGEGSLTIQGTGTLNVTSGTAGNLSFGIHAQNSVTINSGAVTATGGAAPNNQSFGIRALNNDLTINGGTVTATGVDAKHSSNGLWAGNGSVTISGGKVVATGGGASSGASSGIYANNVEINNTGAIVTATGGTQKNGHSFGIYVYGGKVTFSGGTLTAATKDTTCIKGTFDVTGSDVKTISFDGNGGSGGMVAKTTAAEYTLPENAFTAPDGKQFKGWKVGEEIKAVGGKIDADDSTIVYAQWEDVEYTVTVTGGTASPSGAQAAGTSITISANEPAAGQRFKEWTGADGLTFTSGSKTSATATFTMPDRAVALIATYEDIPVATTYTVTFNANGGSVTPASAETGADGKLTSLPTPTRSRYSFNGWYTEASGGTKVDTDYVFNANTTIYANWTYTGGGGGGTTRYTVSFETNGGSKVSSKTVTRNTAVSEPTAPTKDGYTFDGWYSDKELTTAYDFSAKVTKSFTLYAKWTEKATEPDKPTEPTEPTDSEWENPFTDVKKSDWFYTNVEYAVNNKLMNGTTATTFAPSENLTRAMLVAILYRAEGEPAVNKSIPFSDVDTSAYYANAVIWVQQNGIVNGVTENAFAPDDNITREQIAAIMFRYAKYKGYDVSVGESTNILSYTDAESISEYAISAMQWACGSGLMKGKTETSINPQDNATRAEIAAILQRFIEANK